MGSRGPLGRGQGHRTKAEKERAEQKALLRIVPRRMERPDPPAALSEQVLEAWDRFWSDDVANAVTPASLPSVLRLFSAYERLERAWKIADTALAVKGSKDQLRLNPIATHALNLEGLVLRLEAELGLTPMARARLGLTVGQAELTVDQVNRLAKEKRGRSSIRKEIRDGFEEA